MTLAWMLHRLEERSASRWNKCTHLIGLSVLLRFIHVAPFAVCWLYFSESHTPLSIITPRTPSVFVYLVGLVDLLNSSSFSGNPNCFAICLTDDGWALLWRQNGWENGPFPPVEVPLCPCKALGNHGNWLGSKGQCLALTTDRFNGCKQSWWLQFTPYLSALPLRTQV